MWDEDVGPQYCSFTQWNHLVILTKLMPGPRQKSVFNQQWGILNGPPRAFGKKSENIFGYHHCVEELLESSKQRPGIHINIHNAQTPPPPPQQRLTWSELREGL